MSENQKQIAIFKGKQIRRVWDEAQEKWFFSVVDVVAALSRTPDFLLMKAYA